MTDQQPDMVTVTATVTVDPAAVRRIGMDDTGAYVALQLRSTLGVESVTTTTLDPDAPAHVLITAHQDAGAHAGQSLVTIYGDGTGELAWRGHESDRWAPPVRLEPAP